MRVHIHLFAAARELGGTDRVAIDLPEEATFYELRQQLQQDHPALTSLLGYCRFAQGNEMASDSTQVDPKSKIALIPPVSGG